MDAGALRGGGRFTGPTVAVPFGFTHVGLHWKYATQESGGSQFEVRTSGDGHAWTDWQPVVVEASPQETPGKETYGALLSAPRHSYVEYRASLDSDSEIATVTVTAINSMDGQELDGGSAPASLATKPITFAREAWGADERLRFQRNGREIWPRMYVPVKKLVVHHTATANNYPDVEAAKAEVRAIYTYHAKTLGWGDIGYNALVDTWGNVYEGRFGRSDSEYGVDYGSGDREVFGQDVVAGHAYQHNYGSCGVAALGNFETLAIDGNSPVVLGILSVLEYEARLRRIDSEAVSDFLCSDGTWNRGLANVCGHRDTSSTVCPGFYLYWQLGAIRQTLAQRLAASNPSSPPPAPLSGPDGGAQSANALNYTWDGGGGDAEYSHCLEGWYKSSSSEAISYLTGYTADRLPEFSPWSKESSASFTGLKDGHYTFHLRTRMGTSEANYGSNKTVLISGSGSGGSTKPGGGKKPR